MDSIREELKKISPTFCAAKWLQVTMHLQNGNTHSCHHPTTHKVPLSELKTNSSALHNTQKKKLDRKKMLEGERPSECAYCWRVEDLPGQQTSDRYIKSSDSWARPYLQEIAAKPWQQNVVPTYLEVSFSNICNFKCAYCQPQDSSRWMSEVKEFGPYPTSDHFGSLLYARKNNTLPLPQGANPYNEAFWQWFPQVHQQLHELRVTGGEPLLSKDCDKLLDYLITHPAPQLILNINSNLGIPTQVLDKTLRKIKFLRQSQAVKEVHLYTSLDTWGRQAEYLRYGLDLNLWQSHVELVLASDPDMRLTIMVTYNALSVFQFIDFLEFVSTTKKKFKDRLLMDISILHSPLFLSVLILPDEHRMLIQRQLDFMEASDSGFVEYEIAKMRRLVEFSRTHLKARRLRGRRNDFVSFVAEYDRRKKTDFAQTFPELEKVRSEWEKSGSGSRSIFKVRNNLLKVTEAIFFK